MRNAVTVNGVDVLANRAISVLSPHLDDAVLSCGALLAACAQPTVITVFNGRPELPLSADADDFHRRCGLGDDAVEHRETEDDRALDTVGAVPVRLGIPEALYRRDESGGHRYPREKDISVGTLDAEAAVVADVAERLRNEATVQDAELLIAPLGVGKHIDHLIVGAAVRMLNRNPKTVLWYEDVPYILFPAWLRRRVKRDRSLGPQVYRFDGAHWQAKLSAIDCYASQRAILWWKPAGLAKRLTAHATRLGGGVPAERYWVVSDTRLPGGSGVGWGRASRSATRRR